jgi:uncharacterized protein (TIRG00374 family)
MRLACLQGTMTLVKGFRSLCFLAGLTLLGGMLWHVGLAGLSAGLQVLGLWLVPFFLLDSVSLLLHTAGWAACFPDPQRHIRLWRLCLVRMAGGAINQVTPTADLGGEVAKVLLLGSLLPRAQAVAAVVIDKTSIALAQIGYLNLGTVYVAGHLPLPAGAQRGVHLTTGLIALGLGGFVVCQRYGLLSTLAHGLGGYTYGQAKLHWLSQRLASLDAHLVAYYTAHPWRFGRSLLLHFLAFVFDAIQTYILLCLLLGEGAPEFFKAIVVAVAVAILEQIFFFVPGRLGTMEGIRFTVLSALGIGDVYALAFGLVARLHHLFWNGLGLLAYAVCMRWPGLYEKKSVQPASHVV